MKHFRNTLFAAATALCLALTGCTSVQDDNSDEDDISSVEAVAEESVGNAGDVEIRSGDTVAEIEIEGFGTIKAKLFPDIAPVGVKNFSMLAEQGYYDGKTIHRVIEDFMFQGGSENGDGTGGDAAYSGEGSSAASFGTEIDENARHIYGALCYANALGQNSTQFYIVNNKQPQELDGVDTDKLKSIASQAKAAKEAYSADTAEYKYYAAMEKQYSALAEWLKQPSDALKDKYKNGGTPSLDGGYTVFGQVVEGFDVIDKVSAVEVTENGSGEMSKPVEDIIIKTVRVYTAK